MIDGGPPVLQANKEPRSTPSHTGSRERDLAWSTFHGGSDSDEAGGIAVDRDGNVYVTGVTYSSDFPTLEGDDANLDGDYDAFVSKFGPDGTLVWSTYLGGRNADHGSDITVNTAGDVFVTGYTGSDDFPTLGGYDTSLDGSSDVFLTRFGPDGDLRWSTYLGGSGGDLGQAITAYGEENVYLTGCTNSADFPTPGGYETDLKGGNDAFVTKFSIGGALRWSTYLGGHSNDTGYGITADAAENVYVTGETWAGDFPVLDAADETLDGDYDAFVSKFNPDGVLCWSTYLGGNKGDAGAGIVAAGMENLYLTGWTRSTDFFTPGAYDTSYNGGWRDAFVSKFSGEGTLRWSTYLGGSHDDRGWGIALDESEDVVVAGEAESLDFPVIGGYAANSGYYDAFVARFSPEGRLVLSTYLGGENRDIAYAVARSPTGGVCVTGRTSSSGFPAVGGYDRQIDGTDDAFVSALREIGCMGIAPRIWDGLR